MYYSHHHHVYPTSIPCGQEAAPTTPSAGPLTYPGLVRSSHRYTWSAHRATSPSVISSLLSEMSAGGLGPRGIIANTVHIQHPFSLPWHTPGNPNSPKRPADEPRRRRNRHTAAPKVRPRRCPISLIEFSLPRISHFCASFSSLLLDALNA